MLCVVESRKRKITETPYTSFNANASNTELLFRIIHSFIHSFIHSANQLSIYGAVSNCCEPVGLTEEEKGQDKQKESVTKGVLTSVKSQEVKLLVSSPRLVSGNSLQENIHDFESLSEKIRFRRVCEDAVFPYRLSAGVSYKTRLDEDDDLGRSFHYAENTRFLW